MILTGPEILKERSAGHITIEPFIREHLNPNSYNYRLGPTLGVPRFNASSPLPEFDFVEIPPTGLVLPAGVMHLGHTVEQIGSSRFAMSLIGRSSIGRLGLFLQVSANLGHTGTCHQWTLELVATKPIRLYSQMRIGQVSFWRNMGEVNPYAGGYSAYDAPTPANPKRFCATEQS